ncbi:Uncharacterised protein [Salmonella enterica subsp. enterica serovar Typhimurium str. DT104]|nr:Uncharacterised protein [Salmonella enterica subsp. enterica serovar Typhimurium str. DT104]
MRTNPLFHLRTRRAAGSQTKCRRSGRGACCQGATLNTCVKRRGGGYRFHWRYGRRDRYRRFDRHVLFYRLRNRLIPCRQLFALTGAFLFHLFKIVKRRTGRSGLFCVRFRLGGNRLFDNRRRHVRRFSRYRLRLINRRRLMGRLRLPLRLCFLRRKRVIFCCGRWRRGVLRRGSDRHRLLPRRTLRLLRLSILRMRLIPLRRRRDNRFAGLRPRYGLPLHGRLRDNRLSPRHGRRLHYGIGGRCPRLGDGSCSRSGGDRFGDRMAV